MKIKYLYASLLIIIAALLSIAASNNGEVKNGKTNKDVIKFSHAVHAEATDCAGCHTNVSGSLSLSDRLLPEKSVCATCHDVEDDKQCSTCHYEDVYEPLVKVKSELMFNHKMHIEDQKMLCENCHKGLSDVAYSFETVSANPPMMTCYSCHNGKSVATNDCEICHTSTANLIPEDHRRVSFAKNHKFHAQSEKAECQMCHDNASCESCHVGTTMLTEANTSSDFYVPYSPHKFTDNSKLQKITRVHDINYRFTHGIDLKSKTNECQTCHQRETFCAECHSSAGGDFALGGMVPTSHKSPNFVTVGVGTGGGQHAILAKRDIERCASCHDVQGADANCVMCHSDNDGIRGTNPKTHRGGFKFTASSGDWHNDMNSVCYQCHTDANARPGGIKGLGFCGYCHKL
jgi:hypothetical protein